MSNIYIEYLEDRIVFPKGDVDKESNETLDTDIEKIIFAPLYAYRTNIEDSIEYEVGFDLSNLNMVHLVIMRYRQEDDFLIENGKWHIYGVYPSRREALAVASKLDENDEMHEDQIWDKDGCQLEEIQVVSLNIEE